MQAIIQIRDLFKTYGNGSAAVHALEGVSLDVNAGEVLVLMGPSGSGKTTLLSIMGGILSATRGSVRVDGQEIVGIPEHRLPAIRKQHYGFIFQGFNLFPALTARQNVAVMCKLKGMKSGPANRLAAELLERVGLGAKLGTYPSDLSGGQKQRVAIARALAGNPGIILADEPTASLDSASGRTVLEILSGLAREKERAVVIVTHDPRVLEYCHRIVHIEDGRICSEETRMATTRETAA